MPADEANAFLSFLAVDRHVSASTQNQALSALLFLDREVLQEPLPWLDDLVRVQRPERLPVVLTVDEVRDVIEKMRATPRLAAMLLYGSGLRLLEVLTLRVKDVDFERGQITVRDPKWKRDRATMLPRAIDAELREQVLRARTVHAEDLAHGWGSVWLPDALARKFPSAPRETRWQWVFPAPSRWRDRDGNEGRHHLHETIVQRAVTRATPTCSATEPAASRVPSTHERRRISRRGGTGAAGCAAFGVVGSLSKPSWADWGTARIHPCRSTSRKS